MKHDIYWLAVVWTKLGDTWLTNDWQMFNKLLIEQVTLLHDF